MKDNPYSKIIQIIKDKGSSNNPPSIQIAEVISPPPNLIIKIGDLQVDSDNILIADYLLKEHKRRIIISGERIKFTQTDPIDDEINQFNPKPIDKERYLGKTAKLKEDGQLGSDRHILKELRIDTKLEDEPEVLIEATREDKDYIKTVDTLAAGDLLAVMPVEDKQLYLVIARLVGVS